MTGPQLPKGNTPLPLDVRDVPPLTLGPVIEAREVGQWADMSTPFQQEIKCDLR